MRPSKLPFRVLVIDDDTELNDQLSRIIRGKVVRESGTEIIPDIDVVDVALEPDPVVKGRWTISQKTLARLDHLSGSPRYDLILVDYGYITEEGRAILWPEGERSKPTQVDARGCILTVVDLRDKYNERAKSLHHYGRRFSIFDSAKRVIMHTFASRLAYDILGPVKHRHDVAQGAFPNATIVDLDTRQEFLATDQFYGAYEDQRYGRAFYRHLLCTYMGRMVESEMYRYLLSVSGKIRVRRSVFNIALFAGAVAMIGVSAEYLAALGLSFLSAGQNVGWMFLLGGFGVITVGALVLAVGFERFSRSVIRWVGPEEGFD